MPFWDKARTIDEIQNRVVVVSVEDFDPGVGLAKRKGVGRDVRRLHKVLCKLGFKVEFHSDPTAREVYELFENESRKTVDSCFIGIISSHGEEGVVFGSDGNQVHLSRIFGYFNGPAMTDKTKLFLVQACRGHDLDDGVEVETDSPLSNEEEGLSHSLSIPIDTAIMYATSPGYSAFMHPLGSVFLQTLCDLLENDGGSDLEIHRLMTRLNYHVAYNFQARGKELAGKKEMPCFVSRLTKEVFPFRDSKQGTKERSRKHSATALVERSQMVRKASIS